MRASPIVVLAVAAALVGALLAYDAIEPSSATTVPELVEAGGAVSGSWYCAAGDTNEGRTTSVIFAPVPGAQPGPTDVVVSTFGEGERRAGSETRVLPQDVRVDELPSGQSSIGVSARWWGQPAVLSRVWRVGGADFPSGWVAGPCEPTPSATWIIPGLSTAGGGQGRVVLANPFESDATAAITLATPSGFEQPRRLENLLIPAGSVRDIVLNEHAPQQDDLGVIVEVLAGRLVTEGVQTFNAAIGGVDGATLVKAAPAAATRWTIPWLQVADRVGSEDEGDQDGVDSWVWITNPSETIADVQINLHTTEGSQAPGSLGSVTGQPSPAATPEPTEPTATPTEGVTEAPGGSENLETFFVDPGAVVRVDMADLLPEGNGAAGVSVESHNDVPIVVSGGTVRRDPAAVLSSLAIQLGAAQPDTTWVWSAPPPTGRTTHLQVVNLGETEATLSVQLHTGGAEIVALEREITVAPGALANVDLTDDVGDADQLTVYVTSDQPVVAGYRSLNVEGRPDLVVGLGASSSAWRGGSLIPVASYRSGLVHQLDTGGEFDDEGDVVEDRPAFEFEPGTESESEVTRDPTE